MSKKSFNISLLGEGAVGKTSIVTAYTKNDFNFETLETTGIDFSYKKKTFDKKEYKFKIYDTAGQERYNSISATTIQIADGFLMVFAVNERKSFEKIVKWINFINDHVNLEEKVLFLIGNKCDLDPEEIEVKKEEAEKLAKSFNAKYFETSAKTRKGINEAFEDIFKDVYEMYKKNENNNKTKNSKKEDNKNNKNSKFNLNDNNNAGNNENIKRKRCFFF